MDQADFDARDKPENRWWKVLRHFMLIACLGWLIFPIYAFWLWEWWQRKKPPSTDPLRWDKPPGGGAL